MKALLASFVFALSTVFSTAAVADQQVEKAEQTYAEREYSNVGLNKALEAAALYGQIATQKSAAVEKAQIFAKQSEALYFAGHASDAKADKIKYHLAGLEAGDQALVAFGVSDVQKADAAALKGQFQAADLRVLAEALYHRGANLGQWGHANGVSQSLGRWPELKANMQLIIDLGFSEIHEYGALRTLGRGNHQIPALLGGSNKRAEKYLSQALTKTKAAGEIYSVNGFNNTFYAELLRDIDREDEGRELLEAFVKADAAKLNPRLVPETKRAQRDAQDLLKNW